MKKIFIPLFLLVSFGLKAQTQQQTMQNKQVTLTITVAQAQQLLDALADRKLGEGIDLYLSIRGQVLTQLTPTPAKTDSTKTKTPAKKTPAKDSVTPETKPTATKAEEDVKQ